MRKITSSIVAGAMVLSFAGAALAVTDDEQAATQVEVQAFIALSDVPASIDFGAGVPGDLVSDGFTANVETNNSAGYKLEVTTSDMTGADLDNTDSIPASDLSYNGSSPADDETPLQLHSQSTRSAEGGDSHVIDVDLTIPFVNTDTYSGTADFVASTL